MPQRAGTIITIYMFHLIWIGQVCLAAFALRPIRAGRTTLLSLIKIIIGG